MADPYDKVAGQPPGRYYVDSQCIDCDLCRETAPANFMRNDEAGFSYVFQQPAAPASPRERFFLKGFLASTPQCQGVPNRSGRACPCALDSHAETRRTGRKPRLLVPPGWLTPGAVGLGDDPFKSACKCLILRC